MTPVESYPAAAPRGRGSRLPWLAFAVLCGTVLADLALYLVQSAQRSTSLWVLSVGLGAVALAGIAASVVVARLTPAQIDRLRARAAPLRPLYFGAGLLILFAYGLGLRPEWLYAHIAIMLGAGFALGCNLLYDADARPMARLWLVVAGVVALVVTLVRINGLSVYPAYNINDEPWVLGWALSYLRQGYLSDPIMYYGGADVQRFMLPVAWWLQIVGVGFWQARLFFFGLIFPMIALTARAAHNLYGSGWVTALVMFSSAVVMGGARIRHDIGLALAVAAALWLYSEGIKRGGHRWHFAAGLVMGLGAFAHYHATLFGVMLGIALYLPSTLEGWRQGKRLPPTGAWLFALGGLVGAGAVVVLQILPDWEHFQAVRQLRSPLTLDSFWYAFTTYWGSIAFYSQLEFLLLLAGAAAALWRRTRIDGQLVLLLVLLHIALPLQASSPYPHYVLPISPVYALLIAALFTRGFGGQRLPYAGAAAAAFMVANLGFTMQVPVDHLLRREPLQSPIPPVAAWIRANVLPSESVVTEHWYYLFLLDYPFISPLSPDYAPFSQRLDTKAAMWDQIAPDVVVIDRNLSTCCVQQPIYDAGYLQARGYRQVAELPGEHYPVYVYRKGDPDD